MWNTIKDVLMKLFGRKSILNDHDAKEQNRFTREYADLSDINFTSIFANKLSSLTVTDSTVNVVDNQETTTKRVILLAQLLNNVWDKSKKITAQAFGTGGVVLLPYSAGGKIYTDIVPQNRFFIGAMQGDDIIEATVLADVILRDDKMYQRFVDYSLENSDYVIRNRATRDNCEINLWGCS